MTGTMLGIFTHILKSSQPPWFITIFRIKKLQLREVIDLLKGTELANEKSGMQTI